MLIKGEQEWFKQNLAKVYWPYSSFCLPITKTLFFPTSLKELVSVNDVNILYFDSKTFRYKKKLSL